MLILISGATATMRRMPDRRLGVLLVPMAGNSLASVLVPGREWAIDNGAFSEFNPEAFVALIAEAQGWPRCRFVAVPDVVGDATATAARFAFWAPVVRRFGFPVALVAQDGLTVPDVPWDGIDALFIGGHTDWKLGRTARTLVAYARARGKWVHMGRVNSRRRLRYAAHIGVQSVDGTGWSMFPDTRIPMALRWLDELARPELPLSVAS